MECPYCKGTGDIDTNNVHVGMMILNARQAANMSQLELAGKVGKSRPQIANIEGGRASFDVKMLSSFAKALGVPAKELIP